MLGPTGIGGLWARAELLDAMPPFLGGGEMIRDVNVDGFTTNDVPWKFEAGTPPIAEAIGLGAAVDYLTAIGLDAVRAHERTLTGYALDALTARFEDRLAIYGPRDLDTRGGAISFAVRGHPRARRRHRSSTRTACASAPAITARSRSMRVLGVPATARASFYVYNDEADVDALVESLARAEKFFAF